MSVHRYLRAVGFSNIEKREQLQEIIGEVVTKTVLQETRPEMEQSIRQLGHHATKDFVADGNDRLYAELCLDFAKMRVSVYVEKSIRKMSFYMNIIFLI